MEQAEDCKDKGEKDVAAVVASAVLEDTVKKIAKKHNVTLQKSTLDPRIDELAKAGVVTNKAEVKRLKSYATTRNHAFHAEWEHIESKDVDELIKGVRNLIADYL